jgi:hypothetical protein
MGIAENYEYNAYEVVKPFSVQSSKLAPAFGKFGKGTQFKTPIRGNILLKRNIIKKIN